MALDGATAAYLLRVVKSRTKPLHEMTPEEARRAREFLKPLLGKGPEMAGVEEVAIATPTGPFSSRLFVPTDRPRGLLVWLHGGGWVLGSVEESDTFGRVLARRANLAVLVAGYRLAPEHRFPTAVDDACAALDWAHENVGRLAGPGAPVLVGGDSAGGNLAAVACLRARDQGGRAVAQQILVCPVVDARFDRPSYLDRESQLALTREGMRWFWDHYAPDAGARLSPGASPLRARDLSGLPPAIVLTAEHDVLRDEGEEYAAALVAAGVPVVFERFAGQIHTFLTLVNILPAADAGIDFVARAIELRLGEAP
jgi:acetyl esterase